MKYLNLGLFLAFLCFFLNSCGTGADARKFPPNPEERVKRNLEQGKGFRLMDQVGKKSGNTNYDFASSNELWRASLDTIDFMPLTSANYSRGILITDWYSDNEDLNKSIKITIRFLTNEIRSDALEIKVFHKTCLETSKCKVLEKKGSLNMELRKEILKKAAIYKKQSKDKSFKPYPG